jgi:hypothetical protein
MTDVYFVCKVAKHALTTRLDLIKLAKMNFKQILFKLSEHELHT